MKEESAVQFLTLAEVVDIHKNQIELHGGEPGIRDIKLLSSAISMPGATFNNEFLHRDIFEMAGAYCFHICKNHPFIDGNKRTALVSALVFLDFNNIEYDYPGEVLYNMIMDIISGKAGKDEISRILRERR